MEIKTTGYSKVGFITLWGLRALQLLLIPFLISDFQAIRRYWFVLFLVTIAFTEFFDSRNTLKLTFVAGESEKKTFDFQFSTRSLMPKIFCNGEKILGSRNTTPSRRNQTYVFQVGYGEIQTITVHKNRNSLQDYYAGKYSFQILINREELKSEQVLYIKK